MNYRYKGYTFFNVLVLQKMQFRVYCEYVFTLFSYFSINIIMLLTVLMMVKFINA